MARLTPTETEQKKRDVEKAIARFKEIRKHSKLRLEEIPDLIKEGRRY